jgi:hypothetical protein
MTCVGLRHILYDLSNGGKLLLFNSGTNWGTVCSSR